jgi:hypothetical protein
MTLRNQQSGFALLMTLLVVAVVVSITLTVIELSIKQLNLSVTAKDSEIAFHAANAGMECVRYVRRTSAALIEDPDTNSFNFDCFNQRQSLGRQNHGLTLSGGDGALYRYRGQASWATGDRCSVIDFVTMIVPETETSDMQVSGLNAIYPGYPASDVKTCSPGSVCTVAEVVGYNKSCSNITTTGTVRREILLEF